MFDPGLPIDQAVAFGSRAHLGLGTLVLAGRALDLFSTWLVTPSLSLEANPLARRLGWRGGLAVSALAAVFLGLLPVAALSVATTSSLVAARNAQSAWLVRSMGEERYRLWLVERFRNARRGHFLASVLLNAAPFAVLGAALMAFSAWQVIPFSVGLGMAVYAVAILVFTSTALRRAARRPSPHWAAPPPTE